MNHCHQDKWIQETNIYLNDLRQDGGKWQKIKSTGKSL